MLSVCHFFVRVVVVGGLVVAIAPFALHASVSSTTCPDTLGCSTFSTTCGDRNCEFDRCDCTKCLGDLNCFCTDEDFPCN